MCVDSFGADELLATIVVPVWLKFFSKILSLECESDDRPFEKSIHQSVHQNASRRPSSSQSEAKWPDHQAKWPNPFDSFYRIVQFPRKR